VPTLLAGMLPWTPVLVLLGDRKFYQDRRLRFLLLWVAVGLLFFSAVTNKLPGYLLPLLPALAALGGIALARAGNARWILALVAVLLLLLPVAAQVLPDALAVGLSHAPFPRIAWFGILGALLLAGTCWWWDRAGRRQIAVLTLAIPLIAGVAILKHVTFPRIDQAVSARPLWRQIREHPEQACVETLHRNWRYGLNYYSVDPLPDCSVAPRPLRIEQEPGRPPQVNQAAAP
jgi:4-amino-4-deoxy-L-arabinose transferase-like glycosyltransferase